MLAACASTSCSSLHGVAEGAARAAASAAMRQPLDVAPAASCSAANAVPTPRRRRSVREERAGVLQQPRRDDQAVDLVGALVDARDARVAVGALDRELARIAVAAEHLHRLVHDVGERLARPHLVDRALDGEALDGLEHAARRRPRPRPRARDRRRRARGRPSPRRRSTAPLISASFCLTRPNSQIALPNWRRSLAYADRLIERLLARRRCCARRASRGRG